MSSEQKSGTQAVRCVCHCFSYHILTSSVIYINNSLHLARKYARMFVRGHYLFREANSFPRAKLEENCELRIFFSFSWEIFAHVTRLGISRASENILWIIILNRRAATWNLFVLYNQEVKKLTVTLFIRQSNGS